VAFAGPALPSLFNHRFGVDAELLRHQSQDRGEDFSHLCKPPIRPEEKQQDGEGKSIGTALTGDADNILRRERPCVDRIFRIVRCSDHGFLIEWMHIVIAR
jgi:hypothetical protein